MVADEVCRTGDANNDELRAIRRTLERGAVRPSPAERRLAAGAPTVTLRRRIA
jgi:hypothetical protein